MRRKSLGSGIRESSSHVAMAASSAGLLELTVRGLGMPRDWSRSRAKVGQLAMNPLRTDGAGGPCHAGAFIQGAEPAALVHGGGCVLPDTAGNSVSAAST